MPLVLTLREYLQTIGLSVYGLAIWVHEVSPQMVYAIANGSRRPSLDALDSIIKALHEHGHPVMVSDLLRWNEPDNALDESESTAID